MNKAQELELLMLGDPICTECGDEVGPFGVDKNHPEALIKCERCLGQGG